MRLQGRFRAILGRFRFGSVLGSLGRLVGRPAVGRVGRLGLLVWLV